MTPCPHDHTTTNDMGYIFCDDCGKEMCQCCGGEHHPEPKPSEWIRKKAWELEEWPVKYRSGEMDVSEPPSWVQAILDYLDEHPR